MHRAAVHASSAVAAQKNTEYLREMDDGIDHLVDLMDKSAWERMIRITDSLAIHMSAAMRKP
jgi:hypothetical protein